MATPTSPAARLQVIALHEAKLTYEQISSQLGIHRQTVSSIIRKHDIERKAKDAAAIATREDILRRMTKIMYDTDRSGDAIAAAKLIAMMQGWLTQQNEPIVNVNLIGNADVSVLEREYKELTGRTLGALESPTTQSKEGVDTLPLLDAQTCIVGQPGDNMSHSPGEKDGDGGQHPPKAGGTGI